MLILLINLLLTIGKYAFQGCTALGSVTIPTIVTTIGIITTTIVTITIIIMNIINYIIMIT